MAECAACGERLPDLAVACPRCWTPPPRGGEPDLDPHLLDRDAPGARGFRIGEVVYSALGLYRRHAPTLLVLAAVAVVPSQLLSALVLAMAPSDADVLIERPFFTRVPPPPDVDVGALVLLLAARLVVAGLGLVAIQLVVGASFRAIRDVRGGIQPDWRASLSAALERWRSLLWLATVPSALIGAGLLLGVVPGLWLYASWALAVPVFLDEGERGASALRRSVRLVRGHWWRVFGLLVLTRFITFVFGLIVDSVLALLVSLAGEGRFVTFGADLFARAAAYMLTTPFLAVVIALLYFELTSTATQPVAQRKRPRKRTTPSRAKSGSGRTRAKPSARRPRKPPPARG